MADTPEDPKEIFRRAVGRVRILTQDKVAPFKKRPRPVAHQAFREREAVLAEMFTDAPPDIDVGTGEELLFLRPGVQKNVLRRFRRGHFSLEAELDLHGLTVEQARATLAAFLHQALTEDRRCVRIIHGKGLRSEARLPVLKGCVNTWLQHNNDILAFCSARPEDGGTGAVYVLLRKGR